MTAQRKTLILAGPTASGKSALALALAQRLNGVVINADSMQMYRDLSILTARPDARMVAAAPHRLYGVLDGAEVCSAARWRQMALPEIHAAHRAGRLPILCGGTGLYIEAMTRGLSDIPDIPPPLRREVRDRLERQGAAALHRELQQRDPATAARLPAGDSQRIARALEVVLATGRGLSHWQASRAAEADEGGGETFLTVALLPPREVLHARCNARFDAMMRAGAAAEVAALTARRLDVALPVMRALGVREIDAMLRGDCTAAEAAARTQTATRRYVKRQTTWIRNRMNPDAVLDDIAVETAMQAVLKLL